MKPVKAQGWERMLPRPTDAYLSLVRFFYYNLEVGTLENNEFPIDTRVRGNNIVLNPIIFSNIIGVPNDRDSVFIDKPSILD